MMIGMMNEVDRGLMEEPMKTTISDITHKECDDDDDDARFLKDNNIIMTCARNYTHI